MFRSRGETVIDERAKKMARMVEFICYELRTKTYDHLLPVFPIRDTSPTRLNGTSVNYVFICSFRRRAGMRRLPNILLTTLLTFTSKAAATIGAFLLAEMRLKIIA